MVLGESLQSALRSVPCENRLLWIYYSVVLTKENYDPQKIYFFWKFTDIELNIFNQKILSLSHVSCLMTLF